jgi:hypothetical protein
LTEHYYYKEIAKFIDKTNKDGEIWGKNNENKLQGYFLNNKLILERIKLFENEVGIKFINFTLS